MEHNTAAEKYEFIRTLGRGGTGTVYLVKDKNLQICRAVKEITYGNEQEALWKKQSLEAEVNILKQTDHPMLPKIMDLFHTEQASYLVMEYIEGMSLEEYIRRNGKVSEKQAVCWGILLTEVLSYMHHLQPPVLYLDMKPANVIVRRDNSVKLIDFGAAVTDWREAADKQYMGTRGYAAPEQEKGGSVDMRTDVYAVGATLYQLVTGISPALQRQRTRTVREWDATISRELESIISRAMCEKPKGRYCSMEEMRKKLQDIGTLHIRKLWRRGAAAVLTTLLYATGFILFVLMVLQEKYEVASAMAVFMICVNFLWNKRQNRKHFIVSHVKNLLYTQKVADVESSLHDI